jgi:hypothetical protein
MKKFKVRYTLSNFVYESEVWTDSSGAALYWVINTFPDAMNVTVVE